MRRIALIGLWLLSGCTHAWDWDGGASWDAQQRALAEQQYASQILLQQAKVQAYDRMVCRYAPDYNACLWQQQSRRLIVMGQILQTIPQPAPQITIYSYPWW